ncbi:MAG: hypothetical protein AB8F34_06715 [Akkermansiaceae bacterium]
MNIKKHISTGSLLVLSAGIAHSDLTFSAPAMETPYVNTQLSKNWSMSMGNYWKYIITGYEYRIYAGVPNGGKVKGGKLRYKTGNATFPGLTTVTAKINGQTIAYGSLSASYLSDNTGQISQTFASPLIIENQDITASFNYSTNMIGGGDYVIIRGSALTAPPIPIGTLIAPSYVRNGGSPTLQWFITKSLGDEVVVVVIPPVTEIESPNSGHGHSNNGHGNNVDGIDSSNPGKSAAKWAQRGYYDTDYDGDGVAEDDEGHGGGSAISKNKKNNPSQN